jgi:hypothetical protein
VGEGHWRVPVFVLKLVGRDEGGRFSDRSDVLVGDPELLPELGVVPVRRNASLQHARSFNAIHDRKEDGDGYQQ